MYVLLITLFITVARAQYQCSCSCCLGQYCQPTMQGTVNVQNCSTEICLAQCRCSYPQCSAIFPYGQISAQCTTPVPTLSLCQCECCNRNFVSCTPTFIGYAVSYACHPSGCGIACKDQYPQLCVSNANGQTQGFCTGSVTSTTTSTTIAPWLGNLCSCLYCQSSYTCTSNILVGITSVSQCSSSACTQACQNRYSLPCSISYLNQINGVCLSEINGKTKCKCNCCTGNGCLDYEINTNDTCTSCSTKCQQVSPCINTLSATYTCTTNHSIIFTNYSILIIVLTLIITESFFF